MPSDRVFRGAGAVFAPLLMMAVGAAAAQTPPSAGPAIAGGVGDPGAMFRDAYAPPMGEKGPDEKRPDDNPIWMLTTSSRLQAELKLNESQVRKLERIEPEFRHQRTELFRQMGPGNSPQKIRAARMALMEIDRGGIARVLTKAQLQRFRQIMLQIDGACLAIRDENISRALRLKPTQMHKVGGLCRRLHATAKTPPSGGGRKERCAAMEEMHVKYKQAKEQTKAEIAAILSDGQRAILRSMAGRPFQMDAPLPPECR
jgi:hypothetical protein